MSETNDDECGSTCTPMKLVPVGWVRKSRYVLQCLNGRFVGTGIATSVISGVDAQSKADALAMEEAQLRADLSGGCQMPESTPTPTPEATSSLPETPAPTPTPSPTPTPYDTLTVQVSCDDSSTFDLYRSNAQANYLFLDTDLTQPFIGTFVLGTRILETNEDGFILESDVYCPSATPTPSGTPSPGPTASVEPTPSSEITPTPTPTPAETPMETPESTPTPSETPSPEPTATSLYTPSPTPTPNTLWNVFTDCSGETPLILYTHEGDLLFVGSFVFIDEELSTPYEGNFSDLTTLFHSDMTGFIDNMISCDE